MESLITPKAGKMNSTGPKTLVLVFGKAMGLTNRPSTVPGTSQIKKIVGTDGYQVPAKNFFEYGWVLGTGQISNDADPWIQISFKPL